MGGEGTVDGEEQTADDDDEGGVDFAVQTEEPWPECRTNMGTPEAAVTPMNKNRKLPLGGGSKNALTNSRSGGLNELVENQGGNASG